jgi:hypothetical protein
VSVIHNNPFRILGLMANATEREMQKQIGIIKRYAEIGKEAILDTDYEFLEPITRTVVDIQVAASKIEQGHKKRHYALFWMVKNSEFDEIAFNHLNENNAVKAIDIWEKTLKTSVTEKNYTSYLNISTLYAALSVTNSEVHLDILQKSFEIKSQVLNSESLKLLSELLSINSNSVDTREISKQFVDESYEWLKPYIDKTQGITVQDFINLFRSYPKFIRTHISDRFIEIPLSNIETDVAKTEILRKEDPQNGAKLSQALYDKSIDDLKQVENILGVASTQYQMLANKLAGETLQCAIDFYNVYRDEDSDFDPGDEALRLCLIAKSIGVTGGLVERIENCTKIIQEWVDGKSERAANEKIKTERAYIYKKLHLFQDRSPSIKNARDLIQECGPKLLLIAKATGRGDDVYIDISDIVINSALGMTINVVNNAQKNHNSNTIDILSETFNEAKNLLATMKLMDMSRETKTRLSTNITTIVGIDNQIKEAMKKGSSACYIATMAYGNYEHPQVLTLREYRDNKLSRSILGRVFIKAYYAISPYIVIALKNRHGINRLIRYGLNIFIRNLKNE